MTPAPSPPTSDESMISSKSYLMESNTLPSNNPNPIKSTQPIHYQITGRAAHSRLTPLLPSTWIDCTSSSTPPTIDFLWENAPRTVTRSYRDDVKCYSHFPNGTSILDSKWVLSRLLPHEEHGSYRALESHCFRGLSGFETFCRRVGLTSEVISECGRPPTRLRDLFPDHPPTSCETPPADNLWVVKDASSNGAGGIWIVSPSNLPHFRSSTTTSPLCQNHKYVAQRYVTKPVLYRGRKCHVRAYALLTSDNRAFVHQRAFLHVANEPFCYSTLDDAEVHITNCCANSHDSAKFAGEICADLESEKSSIGDEDGGSSMIISLQPFQASISASIATFAERAFPLLRGGCANSGFEYLGLDFLLSYTDENLPVAYLLEVNAPPSQDTATGLPHAESVHDDVLRDVLTLWVYPNVLGSIEIPGGWRCVYRDATDKGPERRMMVPSKAALLNKLRWAVLERKALRLEDERWTIITQEESTAEDETDRIAAFARSQFPYFHANNNYPIFFENAGGAQVPSQVIDAVTNSLSRRHRHRLGHRSKGLAKETLLTLLDGDPTRHRIFLQANATTCFRLLAHTYEELLNPGDEIVVARANHDANILPWRFLRDKRSIHIRWWNDSTDVTELQALLTAKTRLVAVSHASNILGTLYPLRQITETIKRHSESCDVVVDGVAAIPHRCPKLSSLKNVDWYVASCHKCFGPHLGVLVGTREVLERVSSRGERDWEAGTVSYEACAGVSHLATYFATLASGKRLEWADGVRPTGQSPSEDCKEDSHDAGAVVRMSRSAVEEAYRKIQCVERSLVTMLLEGLCANPNVNIIEERNSDASARLPIVSFRHSKLPSDEIVRYLDSKGIVCRHGQFLSRRILEAYGVEDVVRVSLLHYNTRTEVETLLTVLEGMDGW